MNIRLLRKNPVPWVVPEEIQLGSILLPECNKGSHHRCWDFRQFSFFGLHKNPIYTRYILHTSHRCLVCIDRHGAIVFFIPTSVGFRRNWRLFSTFGSGITIRHRLRWKRRKCSVSIWRGMTTNESLHALVWTRVSSRDGHLAQSRNVRSVWVS